MYLRKKKVKGQYYWSLVESYRQDGKVKQKTIESLGKTEKAYHTLKSKQMYSDFYKAIIEFILTDQDDSFPSSRLIDTPLIQKVINGNSLMLSSLVDVMVDTCITSPPYYAQRDYGVTPTYWPSVTYRPMPGKPVIEITEWTGCLGLEPTLEMYIGHLVLIFREVWKVLKPEGSLWLNLGDTYCSTAPNSYTTPLHISGLKEDAAKARAKYRPANPDGMKPKDRMGVPWHVAFALQADGWYLRQENIWEKPNCLPESVRDRTTTAHETIFHLTKSRSYYYDKAAVEEPSLTGDNNSPRGSKGVIGNKNSGIRKPKKDDGSLKTKNKRSVWKIATKPAPDTNYAMFPPEMVETCLLATCPENGVALDPFAGRGTVADVASLHKKGFICIELKLDSYNLTVERLSV